MRTVATDATRSVVCVSVCVCRLVKWMYCANTADPIEMPFGGLTPVGPRNHLLERDQDRTNPFTAARGDK